MSKNFADNITAAAATLADAVRTEAEIEDNRINVKMAAIARIMRAGDNPLTNKPHSFSSAEALVNTDDAYAAYLAQLREATHARIVARGSYDAALATARLAVEAA